jgi:glycosyltransferase involved in cell wall biosynthesis
VSTPAGPTALVLADYGGPYRGSFIPALQALARELRERGWALECGFTPVARDRAWLAALTEDEIPVRFAPSADRAELGEWLRGELASIAGPVVLHTHFTSFDLPAAAAASQRPGTAAVWHVHSFLPREPLRVATSVVKFGWLGRRVARILCAGAGPARAVRRRGGRAGQVVELLNGIDTDRFSLVEPAERAAARQALGLPSEGPVLLHFAWDWGVKGGPLFAEFLARLRQVEPAAVGISVGGGAEAAAAARRLGLGDALLSPPADEDVRRFYAAADALVATSRDEGNPFSILEALSCGLPVIATDIPGHRLGASPPQALRLVEADPAALAGNAESLLRAGAGERAAEAADAHGWVERNRGVRDWARRVADAYEAALPARSGAAP